MKQTRLATPPPSVSPLLPHTTPTSQHSTVIPRRFVSGVSHSKLDPPRSWRATKTPLLLPPPANPACARPPRLRPRPAPSVDTIDPLSVETQGPPARSSERCCTRGYPRHPPWLYRPLRVAASRSMPVSLPTHHVISILSHRRHASLSTLSTDTCYFQTSMPAQILPRLLAGPPTTPLLERRHPARPYPL